MIIRFVNKAEKQYAKLPPRIQAAAEKPFHLLQANFCHRSIQAKRFYVADIPDLWQGRITQRWRFYFRIRPGCYEVLAIVDHPKKGN